MVSPHASPCVFIGAGCAEMNSRRSMAGQRLILRFPASVGAARVLRPNVLYWTGSTPLVALLKLYRKLRGVSRPLHYVGSPSLSRRLMLTPVAMRNFVRPSMQAIAHERTLIPVNGPNDESTGIDTQSPERFGIRRKYSRREGPSPTGASPESLLSGRKNLPMITKDHHLIRTIFEVLWPVGTWLFKSSLSGSLIASISG